MSSSSGTSQASQTIDRLGILDRTGDPALRAIARLAGHIAGGSAAGVHILDERVQHRIAAYNAPEAGHPRGDAMCAWSSDTRIRGPPTRSWPSSALIQLHDFKSTD